MVRSGRRVPAGRCGSRIPGPARRAEIRRRRREPALAVRRRLEQPRAAAGRRVSGDGEDRDPRRGRALLRPEHARRAGHGGALRVPRRDAMDRDARQPHPGQPAPQPFSGRIPARAWRGRRPADRDRQPRRGAVARHQHAEHLAVERDRSARAAGQHPRRSGVRRQSRTRSLARWRGRLHAQSARSVLPLARLGARISSCPIRSTATSRPGRWRSRRSRAGSCCGRIRSSATSFRSSIRARNRATTRFS